MRVFVTGANGFIGSAVVRELLDTGHDVVGLARSDAAADAVAVAGAGVLRGDIGDLDSLRRGAEAADGVIHTAYNHDFATSRLEAAAADLRAITAMAEVCAGSDRPLVFTSGTGRRAPGEVATEDTRPDADADATGRERTTQAGLQLAERGVRVSAVCLPPSVHGRGDSAFIPGLIAIARTRGVSAYPGEGTNRWPAVHRLDAAHLFRLAVESAPAGSRLHGVGDEGIPVRHIAEAISRGLGLPARSLPAGAVADHFGFLGPIFALDLPASSAVTQSLLGWHPSQPGLIADLDEGHYYAQVTAPTA